MKTVIDRAPAFKMLCDRITTLHLKVLEIGMARDPAAFMSDGHSTFALAAAAREGNGVLVSIDADPDCLRLTKSLLGRGVRFVFGNAVNMLPFLRLEMFDVAYLDGMDWTPLSPDSERFHWDCFLQLHSKMKPGSWVAFDDVFDDMTYEGKGKMAIPWALDHGWTIKLPGYVTILEKRE